MFGRTWGPARLASDLLCACASPARAVSNLYLCLGRTPFYPLVRLALPPYALPASQPASQLARSSACLPASLHCDQPACPPASQPTTSRPAARPRSLTDCLVVLSTHSEPTSPTSPSAQRTSRTQKVLSRQLDPAILSHHVQGTRADINLQPTDCRALREALENFLSHPLPSAGPSDGARCIWRAHWIMYSVQHALPGASG